jgi:hypothetical protein
MTLLGLSFAVLVARLSISVINNEASRITLLAGVVLAAGIASFASGYGVGLTVTAAA